MKYNYILPKGCWMCKNEEAAKAAYPKLSGICSNCVVPNGVPDPDREFDTNCEDDIICPYCGYIFTDSWESETSGMEICPECDKEFEMSIDYNPTYTTWQVD